MLRVLLTFIHSFIHSFIDSFIHIFTRSLLYLFIYLIIYLFGHATIGLRDLVHPYSQDCTLSLGSWSMAQLHISDRAIRAFFWWWCYFDYIWFCRPIIIFRGVLWCQRIILLICCKIYPADISKRRFIHVSVTYRKPRTCTSHYSHGLWLLNEWKISELSPMLCRFAVCYSLCNIQHTVYLCQQCPAAMFWRNCSKPKYM